MRDEVRDALVARAEADGAVVGFAFTGSQALGTQDRWSDTDAVLAVRGDLAATLERWTRWVYDTFRARHHWDLPTGSGVVRVFLLPGWLELDLTFAPEAEFGPRGPQWRTVFGEPATLPPFASPSVETLTGLVWHHALHATICLHRDRVWQAEHWISALRDHAITLACLRLGLPTAYAKGAHLLPETVTSRLAATLVRAPEHAELRRALTAAVELATTEIAHTDPELAAVLRPMFEELLDPDTWS
ncbi:hypothetical protein ABZ896_11150 [Streptomyces sp. NPDC047072]|uniref:hypothetical protein n=1 Tax=Streptomyces sp. NPDC047072 TaxID=3154809 RepID=UPI0034020743